VHRRPKIRFFGKIGFLTVYRRPKIRFFGKIGFLTIRGCPKKSYFFNDDYKVTTIIDTCV
jgi:hypothetical protein